MPIGFARSLEKVLGAFDKGKAPRQNAPQPMRPPDTANAAERRREWFARFAEQQIMPMFRQTAEAAKKHGCGAECRLTGDGPERAAELVITPPGLPRDALPPRLTIRLAEDSGALALDYTGTFPHAGATGGFGAEIVYDTIYPSELEEEILKFVALATGRE